MGNPAGWLPTIRQNDVLLLPQVTLFSAAGHGEMCKGCNIVRVPLLKRGIMTNFLLLVLVVAVASVVVVLFRGFSGLHQRIDNAIKTASAPLIAVISDIENTAVLVNVGNGTAVDVTWSLAPSGRSSLLPYLAPHETWHIQLTSPEDKISVAYKAISGEPFSSTIDAAKIASCEGHPTLV